MKALLTGSRGFVGRHMRETLKQQNYTVTCVDILNGNDLIRWVDVDHVRYDLIIHAAAAGPNRMAIDTQKGNYPYNVMLDAAMMEWAIRTHQRRFVYLSSSAVYPARLQDELGYSHTGDRGFLGDRRLEEGMANDGKPFDAYGQTKLSGEHMTAAMYDANVDVHIVRPFSGYGEDQSADFPFGAFIARARTHEDPFTIWGNAYQKRDFVHIDDICNAIMAIVEHDVQGPVNLCTGVATSMRELATLVCDAVGYEPQIAVDHNAPMGVMYRVGDPTLLNSIYTPKITIEEGVRRALEL